jgi:PKHD-type hydroxylase
MHHILTPYSRKIEPLAWWENAFSDQELDWLQEKTKLPSKRAQVGSGGGGGVDENIRRSNVSWLESTDNTKWVFNKFAHVVSSLNAAYYGFDLTGFGEPMQLTNYDSSEKGMYGWHVDFGGKDAPSRKLSVVMQLSDPSDYEGGMLELKPSSDSVLQVPKKRGFIAVFPSWTLHQVTPVTQGTRQSLVLWVTGPSFK